MKFKFVEAMQALWYVAVGGLILYALMTLLSCTRPNVSDPPKYYKGDIVYLKPDSTQAVVTFYYFNSNGYYIYFCSNPNWNRRKSVDEYQIFCKKQ